MEVCINNLAKVEGHANLVLCVDDETGAVTDVHLNIYESPRYFEQIVRGRRFDELPLVTSRICGICNFSHTYASMLAVEDAFGIVVSEQTQKLRELLLIGTVIQSHALHLGFLALPDYLGVESMFDIARENQELLKKMLKLRQTGTTIMKIVGGRDIHSVTPRVGGFSKVPSKEDLERVETELKSVEQIARDLFDLYMKFGLPKFERKTSYLALTPNFFEGTMRAITRYNAAEDEWDITVPDNYMEFVEEVVVPYSTARYSMSEGETYTTGALSRININHKYLHPEAKQLLTLAPFGVPCHSPYANNLCQCIELVHCINTALEIVSDLKESVRKEESVTVTPKSGEGVGVAEVPRGTLFHRYKFNDEGRVVKADIIPPTAQFLYNIENDIKQLAPVLIEEGKEKLTYEIEKLIRAYDPCISCATHFLNVRIKRE